MNNNNIFGILNAAPVAKGFCLSSVRYCTKCPLTMKIKFGLSEYASIRQLCPEWRFDIVFNIAIDFNRD